ncbi:unnamed protein product [Urochloa humidicola]
MDSLLPLGVEAKKTAGKKDDKLKPVAPEVDDAPEHDEQELDDAPEHDCRNGTCKYTELDNAQLLAPDSEDVLAPDSVDFLAPDSEDVLTPESMDVFAPPSEDVLAPESMDVFAPGSKTKALLDSLPPGAFICSGRLSPVNSTMQIHVFFSQKKVRP